MSKSKLVFQAVGAGSVVCAVSGWWWRPIADPDMYQENPEKEGPKRSGWMSANALTDFADNSTPLFYELARKITVFITVTAARSFLVYGGNFKIKVDKNYEKFLEKVYVREDGESLITVSNHRSLADDTTIFSSILPYWMNVQPKYLRYSLCAQEYCFNNKFPSVVNAYIGLGKTLPIWRGGGINQKLLQDYARLVAAGEWCHIYPEAGIFVKSTIGGRIGKNEDEIGKLKWGVGKLIAHSPGKTTVIPIFFNGTEGMIKTDPVTRKTLSYLPQGGFDVSVRMGAAIDFSDLIETHEKEYGPLWKYTANVHYDKVKNDVDSGNNNSSNSSDGNSNVFFDIARAILLASDSNNTNNNNSSDANNSNSNSCNNTSSNSNKDVHSGAVVRGGNNGGRGGNNGPDSRGAAPAGRGGWFRSTGTSDATTTPVTAHVTAPVEHHIMTTNTTNNIIHNAIATETTGTTTTTTTVSNSTATSAQIDAQAAVPSNRPNNFHQYWDSKPSDLILYSKIARRIEHALEELSEQNNREKEAEDNQK